MRPESPVYLPVAVLWSRRYSGSFSDDSRYDEEIDVVERARRARPTLVGAEHDAGVSRVRYRGYFIPLHLFTNGEECEMLHSPDPRFMPCLMFKKYKLLPCL